MDATAIFKKLTDACDTVLKKHSTAALTVTKMTQDEFAQYAADQIEKAKSESDDAGAALARLTALRTSITVAKSAFVESKLETFEVPVFDERAYASEASAKRIASLEDTVKELKAKLDKTDDKVDDKTDDKVDAKADDKVDADAKADASKTDDKADAKADDKDDVDKSDKGDDKPDPGSWPMDLSKRYKDDEIRELYDWGPDPRAAH